MIVLVIVHVMPKWRARHVTNSPSPINPAVTPPTARSPDCSNEPRWASIDNDRSNAVSASTGISVSASKRTTDQPYPATASTMPWDSTDGSLNERGVRRAADTASKPADKAWRARGGPPVPANHVGRATMRHATSPPARRSCSMACC